MNYRIVGHDRDTAVHDMLISLLPDEGHTRVADDEGGDLCVSTLREQDGQTLAVCDMRRGGQTSQSVVPVATAQDDDPLTPTRARSYALKTAVYRALLPHLVQAPPWGSLSGVKPAKPARLLLAQGMDREELVQHLQAQYFVVPSRARLCTDVAQVAHDVAQSLHPDEICLYIGIPFCPTKCSYCSFVSNDTKAAGGMIEPYLQALLCEVAAAGQAVRDSGRRVRALYIGGGTPTILDARQLERLLAAVAEAFPVPSHEYTVEAGRPETIDRQKLTLLTRFGVGRISINPQTMQQHVLRAVGRQHTVDDVVRTYHMAREGGDFVFNMDLIAGLPGDDAAGLQHSVEALVALQPEHITIHCLAKKRGAPLQFADGAGLRADTLDAAYAHLHAHGYAPYYLYRQKYMAGGLENVGFCKPGTVSHYNVCMMEELCDVLALGAGAVSKLCSQSGRKIVRLSNPKYPKEYIEKHGDICAQKRQLPLIFQG